MAEDSEPTRVAWCRPPTVAVFAVLVAVAVAAFFLARGVVEDQEDRLLVERAGEVSALLANSIDSLDSSLQVLAPIASTPDPERSRLLAEGAAGLLEGDTAAVGLVGTEGDDFEVLAAAGVGPDRSEVLEGPRAALMDRARAEQQLVADLVTEGDQRRLILARPGGGRGAIAYLERVIDPGEAATVPPESPFSGLGIALYAAPSPDPERIVLTAGEPPSAGQQVAFPVGADSWSLVVDTDESLVGALARNVPWFLLVGGLITAGLVAAITETLARRRAYALALVAERTGELQRSAADLDATSRFLQRLLTAGPVLVQRIVMPERRVTYASPNIESVLGVSGDEATSPDFLERHIHADDRAVVDGALHRVATGASTEEVVEHRVVSGDGHPRWVSAVFVPETDHEGRTDAVLVYTLDIDDRRRAEDARREAQQAAQEANRAKSEFLSRMSHELRTPLNAVLGFGQLLESEDLTESQAESVGHILKGGRHLLELINEVLDISRIEAGDLALSPEAVLVSELVREAVDLVRPMADERGVQIAVDPSGTCECYVFADHQRAKQVLLNLLSNAVKYNRPRGTIAVSCRQPTDTRVHIDVADTGHGIPAERLGQLFTPFDRLGAEQSGVEGTGIGLALSQRLTEAMGGSLTATSTLGEGSTFTVELPRVEGPVQRYERLHHHDEPVPATAGERRVVLHIEDNLSNVTLIERIIAQRRGMEVVAAMHGRLGLELAHEHQPILVLLDLHLPDLDGEQVLQRLRDDPVTASIPVVMVSADATPGQVRRLLTAGATAYLTKPIEVPELLRVLDDALGAP